MIRLSQNRRPCVPRAATRTSRAELVRAGAGVREAVCLGARASAALA
jgi:hypothetical protein